MFIDYGLGLADLEGGLQRLFALSGRKIKALHRALDPAAGTPVFTVDGRYTARGWTEWTQGFLYGWAILQFDACADEECLEIGRSQTVARMASHLTHTGVHDHGFNIVSTYGNLRRLMLEGRLPYNEWELAFYEVALKCSGAVQASRWSELDGGTGYIHSFNGPHSLFIDTMRTLRSLALAHRLGHTLMGEGDRPVSLLERLLQHSAATARYNVYYGEGRDAYDIRGRVAQESIFNMTSGAYRCPSSQQGYSPFSTWTRGLAWAVLGFSEQLEFMASLPAAQLAPFGGPEAAAAHMRKAARATADFYLENCALDGIPYWDTDAPGLVHLGSWRNRPADPENEFEPVDSSAAAISAQGLARLGRIVQAEGDVHGRRYWQAALTMARTLFSEPYLAGAERHQGLIRHSVYHRPNGWDHVPVGARIPRGESSLWGDYHAVELAVYLHRLNRGEPYLTFFGA